MGRPHGMGNGGRTPARPEGSGPSAGGGGRTPSRWRVATKRLQETQKFLKAFW